MLKQKHSKLKSYYDLELKHQQKSLWERVLSPVTLDQRQNTDLGRMCLKILSNSHPVLNKPFGFRYEVEKELRRVKDNYTTQK